MKTLLFITFAIFLSSCSSSNKIVYKTYYRFPKAVNAPVIKSFIIEKPTAIGILGNRPMVAEASKGGLIQMSHNFWLDSPKELLNDYLNKVFITQNKLKTANHLHTKILNLEKKGNNSVLSILFTITNSNGEIIFSKTYRKEESLILNDIPTFVKSIHLSLKKILQEFKDDSI